MVAVPGKHQVHVHVQVRGRVPRKQTTIKMRRPGKAARPGAHVQPVKVGYDRKGRVKEMLRPYSASFLFKIATVT